MNLSKISIFLVLLLALGALPFLAAQETPARAIKLKVTAEQANLRERPDIGSAIVQQIPEGTVLEADKKEGEWYLVRYTLEDGGVIAGYIHESLVTVVEQPPAAGAPAARETKPEARRAPVPRQVPAAGRAASERALPVDIFISAGGSTVSADDFNKGARGLADANGALLGVPASGSVGTLHLTYLLGIEACYRLSPWLSVGLGIDFLKGWRESRITYAPGGASAITPETTTRPIVQAVPVKLSLRFYPRPDFYIRGSAVYNSVKAGYDYRFVPSETSWQQWSGRATTHIWGMEVAAGGEWGLTANLLFFAEAGFRLARTRGLSGTGTYRDSDGANMVETGPLWYYQQRGADAGAYNILLIHAAEPAGSDILGARQAALNVSGTTVRAGITFRF